MLDARLSLAASFYEACDLGADIGSDHGLLPCYLLENKICKRMIVSDISQKALQHAESEMARHNLTDRVQLICADGLDAIDGSCECISITGMGGQTLADILLHGSNKIQKSTLILSAQTDHADVRLAVSNLGMHFEREELCFCSGRYYIVWQVKPGKQYMSEEDIAFGHLLFETNSPALPGYIQNRLRYWTINLRGLRSASQIVNPQIIFIAEKAIEFYRKKEQALSC